MVPSKTRFPTPAAISNLGVPEGEGVRTGCETCAVETSGGAARKAAARSTQASRAPAALARARFWKVAAVGRRSRPERCAEPAAARRSTQSRCFRCRHRTAPSSGPFRTSNRTVSFAYLRLNISNPQPGPSDPLGRHSACRILEIDHTRRETAPRGSPETAHACPIAPFCMRRRPSGRRLMQMLERQEPLAFPPTLHCARASVNFTRSDGVIHPPTWGGNPLRWGISALNRGDAVRYRTLCGSFAAA